MGIMYDNYWNKINSNELKVGTINRDGYFKTLKDYNDEMIRMNFEKEKLKEKTLKDHNDEMIRINFEKEKLEEKRLIEYLLKAARKNVSELKNIDNMKPLDKLRNGVPIRLKTWLKGMFIIFQDNKLYTILNNSVIESNNVSMILSHDDNEWEEYDVPEYKYIVIKEEDYIYFVNNIYNKLKRVELKEHEQNIVFAMKLILEKLI